MSTTCNHCNSQVDNLTKQVMELQTKTEETSAHNLKPAARKDTGVQHTNTTTSTTHPSSRDTTGDVLLPLMPVGKSDHLKLTFPTYGRPCDDTDPLLYLARCQDFLALHPLTEGDLLATFRNVLYGTARDWWEVARTEIKTWNEFQTVFLSAFLSEDYEDELAERVRTRSQGERENVRDFAFTYRALCKRWKPSLSEHEIVKMILKSLKPYLASQLRGRVSTVDELIKLGQQLERDHEHQIQYEKGMGRKYSSDATQKLSTNQTPEKHPVQCWRCKGQHSPGQCPQYAFSSSHQTGKPPHQVNQPRSYPSRKPAGGQATNNSVSAAKINKGERKGKKPQQPSSKTVFFPNAVIPQQLVIPINIASWSGKAILDTGATYTMIHESLWKKLAMPDELKPWTLGPLYLANGQGEIPLGWLPLQLMLHGKTCTLPVVVLSPQALAYTVVAGLDFIFFTGLQINVTDRKYSFKSTPMEEYPFQPGWASVPDDFHRVRALSCKPPEQSEITPNQSFTLLSSVPPPMPTLRSKAEECCKKAQKRQLRSYNKNRRDATFKEKDRVWLRNFPQSSAQRHFSAKLAPKWKGPYRVLKQLGPLNYQITLETTGEDVRTVHVCNLKPCYPNAEELENLEKEKLRVIRGNFQ
nr:uncharacterized protein LOC129426109 [Misgurnus anguillicaudatus]